MSQIHLPHDHGQHTENLFDHMPAIEDFSVVSDIFKLLSDSSRIRIFWLLCHCEECVLNLSAIMGMSSPAVSHHLKQLKAGGLIVSSRKGKEVYYKAADTEQAQLLHHIIEQMIRIACPSDEEETGRSSGMSRQEELICTIHDQLTRHLDRRYTIEELSRQYLINTASLKKTFKEVYGLPIAAYMKEYRIQKAMELLEKTDESISVIAAKVGYETQGKFTNAFKDRVQMTPSCYRKQCRTKQSPQPGRPGNSPGSRAD